MKTYKERKEITRQKAVEFQKSFENNNYYMSEIASYTNYFKKLGKRYGLLEEFRENGII